MTLLRPEILWLLVAVPVGLILALLSKRPRRRMVGSLYLWNQVAANNVSSRRPRGQRLPWQVIIALAALTVAVVVQGQPSWQSEPLPSKVTARTDHSVYGLLRSPEGLSLAQAAAAESRFSVVEEPPVQLTALPAGGLRSDHVEAGQVLYTFVRPQEVPLGARIVSIRPEPASLPLRFMEVRGRRMFVRAALDGRWALRTLSGVEVANFELNAGEALVELEWHPEPLVLSYPAAQGMMPVAGLLPQEAASVDLTMLQEPVRRALLETFGDGITEAKGEAAEFRVIAGRGEAALGVATGIPVDIGPDWQLSSAPNFSEASLLLGLVEERGRGFRDVRLEFGDVALVQAKPASGGPPLTLLSWNPQTRSLNCGADLGVSGIGGLQGFAPFISACIERISGRNPADLPGYSAQNVVEGGAEVLFFPDVAFDGQPPGVGAGYLLNLPQLETKLMAEADSGVDEAWFLPERPQAKPISPWWGLLGVVLLAGLGGWHIRRLWRQVSALPRGRGRLSSDPAPTAAD